MKWSVWKSYFGKERALSDEDFFVWDIMPCILVKVNGRFSEIHRFHYLGFNVVQLWDRSVWLLVLLSFFLVLLLNPERWRRYVPSKRRAVSELHGITSKEICNVFTFCTTFSTSTENLLRLQDFHGGPCMASARLTVLFHSSAFHLLTTLDIYSCHAFPSRGCSVMVWANRSWPPIGSS
jgi:hypothetical protein